MKLFSIFLATAAASCGEGERKDKDGNCAKKCDLFEVTCSVDDGFSLEVNTTCADNQYNHLDLENGTANFFIGKSSIQGNTDAATPFDDECKLGGLTYPKVLENLSFKSCGNFSHKSPPGKDYTVYNGFINHREKLGEIFTSSMDEIEIECRLSHVTLDTKDTSDGSDGLVITENDELDAVDTLTSKELIDYHNLRLVVGIKEGGGWRPLKDGEKVDVGTLVTVKELHDPTTSVVFQIINCQASGDDEEPKVALYTAENGYCPNPALKAPIGLQYDDYESFDVNVFRIKNSKTLKFSCQIVTSPAGRSKRIDCNKDAGRRRRNAEDSIVSAEITTTINIGEEHPQIIGSNALKTCANVIFPSIFFLAIF